MLAPVTRGHRYFPDSEIWYQDISSRALDPNSVAIITAYVGAGPLHLDHRLTVTPSLNASGWGTTAKKYAH